ncbi:MAG TPA: DUF1330 domain-containing protein [Deltaproteobacteria bacterium]|jgi:uncharacterized protein (DUF1330 family)|nr:DUF1330 domain-containing protein [Deltaproteobacteria bacterium]HQI00311.1 DUF1330 domain-containing protein [Deltaproteobacteria bacterium]
MGTVNPTGEQFRDLKKSGKQGTFVMVNLLKFRDAGLKEGESGRQSYERYARAVEPMLKKVGARLLWLGSVDQVFIGEDGDAFDHVMLVEYPSRKAFIDMVSSSEYLVANQDREAGLDRAVLLATDPIFSRFARPKD